MRYTWLEREFKSFKEAAFWFGIFMLIEMVMYFSVCLMFGQPIGGGPEEYKILEKFTKEFSVSLVGAIKSVLIFAFLEEILYRTIPISIAALICLVVFPKYLLKYWGDVLLFMVFATSAFFMYRHGGVWLHLPQLVSAFMLAVFYIKCGGSKDTFLKPILGSTLLHASFNGFLFTTWYLVP